MDGKRLLILAIFGILGIVALEGIMAHANGTVVAKVERDRQVWRQTAEACLAVIRATGQPPRSGPRSRGLGRVRVIHAWRASAEVWRSLTW